MDFNPAILIPVYNHEEAIADTLADMLPYGYDILLVDDGSKLSCKNILQALSKQFPDKISLLRLDKNRGKGAATRAGLKKLTEQGYSHAMQIDADGQHDLTAIPNFMLTAEENFEMLIIGSPQYDESIPKLRYYSRYLTHVWVWINTLSFKVEDSMCGFRIYPLNPIRFLLENETLGDRMTFDTEIVVHWLWRHGDIINLPVKVRYPLDGVSHFNIWQDNWQITGMHSRYFFQMLAHLPRHIRQKFHV